MRQDIREYELKIRRNRVRRQRQLRQRAILFLLASAMLTGIVIGIFTLKAHAAGADEPFVYKYYTSIRLNAGDTLEGIADRYAPDSDHGAYIAEVMRMNHLEEPKITAGMNLA
ncbi:MAG: LysM peptidoglycan-binding domain-containing protein, partial [Lachnospiraceae bacterium]|nr:LysM peptidoglycan-binding domain-containing protein [Lachnospiraceae bacterium]